MRIQLIKPLNSFLSPADLQPDLHHARHNHGLPDGDAAAVRASAMYFVPLMIGARDMAFPRLNAWATGCTVFGALMMYFSFMARRRPGGGLVQLRAADRERATRFSPGIDYWALSLLVMGARIGGHGHQPDRHHPDAARARHEPAPRAAVRLDDLHQRLPGHPGPAGAQRGAGDDPDRPPAQRALLPAGRGRLGAAVAELLLALRPSRGLHPGPAGLRRDLGGHPGLLAQGHLRLRVPGRLDRGHRVPELRRLDAPHVRHRPGLRHSLRVRRQQHADRRSDRHQDLQLDRHHVGRLHPLHHGDAVRRRRF